MEKLILFLVLSFPADCDVPDQEVLDQYSTSVQKKSKPEPKPDRPAVTSKPRITNRFATLLQRRNRDEEEEDSQATHSRSGLTLFSNEN